MQINNIEIPNEGLTKEYVIDSVGGTIYTVFTNVSVQRFSLDEFQEKADQAQQAVAAAQAVADELQAKATEFENSLPSPVVQVLPE